MWIYSIKNNRLFNADQIEKIEEMGGTTIAYISDKPRFISDKPVITTITAAIRNNQDYVEVE